MRLIDANALYDQISDNWSGIGIANIDDILEFVDDQPTIGPESLREYGKWEWRGEDKWNDCYCCSACDKKAMDNSNYCPNCGAKMDGEADYD